MIDIFEHVKWIFSGFGGTAIGYLSKLLIDKYEKNKTNNILENLKNIKSENYILNENVIRKNIDKRVDVKDYSSWVKIEHPKGTNIENWQIAYTFGFLAAIIPGIIVVFLHLYLSKKWQNEYCLYVMEESLRYGDFITGSKYAFKITKIGIPIEYYITMIYNIILECKKNGDTFRAEKLFSKIDK